MDVPFGSQPLAALLGIKEASHIGTVNAPSHYQSLLVGLPRKVRISKVVDGRYDMIHFFTSEREELRRHLPRLKNAIRQSGSIWISWPNKSSGLYSTVDAYVIREVCLPMGLIDIKTCSIDETWTGLQLVIGVDRGR